MHLGLKAYGLSTINTYAFGLTTFGPPIYGEIALGPHCIRAQISSANAVRPDEFIWA